MIAYSFVFVFVLVIVCVIVIVIVIADVFLFPMMYMLYVGSDMILRRYEGEGPILEIYIVSRKSHRSGKVTALDYEIEER